MPPHANPNHGQPQHSAYADGFASPHTHPTTRPVDSVPSWFQETAFETGDIANNQKSSSQSSFKSDDDDSDDDDSASQKSSASTTKNNCAAPEVMELGKWVENADNSNITTSKKLLHACPMAWTRNGQVVKCQKTFGRFEHLRRHFKTHSKERPYKCKVPGCERPFSRGDNLRDHYWTHVERGGRGGKNKKMGIPELKAILGPKEKELAKRLKEKLKIHKEKKELAKKLKYKLNIHKEKMEKA
ncbi:hypothetical protein A1F99_044620 [Pyrenophora tritici-repentis]|nr:hypothetical protein A1F99_044620 [Pyrenophora tritici-repentis]